MTLSSMHTPDPTTNLRTLRSFLDLTMRDAAKMLKTPATCKRIRELREEKQEVWAADHPGERGNPFTQESMAHRIGITRDAYRQLETTREPKLERLRDIAEALEKPFGYFIEEHGSQEEFAQILAAVQETQAQMLEEIQALRKELGNPARAQRRGGK